MLDVFVRLFSWVGVATRHTDDHVTLAVSETYPCDWVFMLARTNV